jgi:threonine dehydrogenase-like Zn-dependent dehydrogenase
MKAVVFHGVGDIRLEDVAEPAIENEFDAVVRITASAICGTDLHFVRGTMAGTAPGTVLGHEGVGIVEQVGKGVRNVRPGDRVVIPSTIACGYCQYCRQGLFAQCDVANPNGPDAGTTFFGGPKEAGGYHGMQAEKVRVPFAHVGLVKIPDAVSDDQAIMTSDIFPTAYFGADLAGVQPGKTVAVFGLGPVGQFAVKSAQLLGASRVIAVDAIADRLARAQEQGAEIINFEEEDPVAVIKKLTGGNGVDCAIDAVGIDATHAMHGPAAPDADMQKQFEAEVTAVAPETNRQGDNWQPGNAPSQAAQWIVQSVAKVGSIGIIGVYSPDFNSYPIGEAMNKNLTIRMGNCNHRKYIPRLLELIRTGAVDPSAFISKLEPIDDVIDAYKHFDLRREGWLKVVLSTA